MVIHELLGEGRSELSPHWERLQLEIRLATAPFCWWPLGRVTLASERPAVFNIKDELTPVMVFRDGTEIAPAFT